MPAEAGSLAPLDAGDHNVQLSCDRQSIISDSRQMDAVHETSITISADTRIVIDVESVSDI